MDLSKAQYENNADQDVSTATPIVVVDEVEPTHSSEKKGLRPKLQGPSGWTESLSTKDIPQLRGSHSLITSPNDPTESNNAPKSGELLDDTQIARQDLSPESARSRSLLKPEQSDDEISIYTTIDRGYTAAEQIYTLNNTTTKGDPSGLFAGIGAQLTSGPSLDELVRKSLFPYGGITEQDSDYWLPFDKVFGLINETSVYEELFRAFNPELIASKLTTDELEDYTRKICSPVPYEDSHDDKLTSSSRSIFAILVLMEEVRCITQFVDMEFELNDKDLPLGRRPNPTTGLTELYSIVHTTSPCLTISKWRAKEYDSFISYQRYMLSPFFKLSTKESRRVRFYDLYSNTILPFIEDHQATQRKYGYHGSVWRVKIHPAHHDLTKHGNTENPYFAVKLLKAEDENGNGFKEEVKAWAKSVGTTGHPHLIQLLATWRQKGRWHLLFPWATGNLLEFWKTYDPDPCPSLAIWISKQCLGIAEGLKKIHRSGSEDPESRDHDWGIHGDIKPENVLLFDDTEKDYGKLVICDFGFTRFHSKETRSNAKPAGYTGTYRAPEYDMRRRISRVYDMWSLGCLYLEFITWYFYGYHRYRGVYDFVKKRNKSDRGEHIRIDEFFVCVSIHEKQKLGAMVKPCILEWIQMLHQHEHCSQFFHDFLDMIEKKLLVINTEDRQRCDMIVAELLVMCNKCKSEGDPYLFHGRPRSTNEISIPSNPLVEFDHFMEYDEMRSSESPLSENPPGGNKWMVASGSSRNRQYNNMDETTTRGQMSRNKLSIERTGQIGEALMISVEQFEAGQTGAVQEEVKVIAEADLDDDTPILPSPPREDEIELYDAESRTITPDPLESLAAISSHQAIGIGANGHNFVERMESEADGEESMVAEYTASELSNDESMEDAALLPASEHEPNGHSHTRRSVWDRAVSLFWRISNWFKHWFTWGRDGG